MRCDDCVPKLANLVEELLSGDEARALREHLARCPSCRAALALEEAVDSGLRMAPAGDLPGDFAARVLARAGVPQHSRRRPGTRWVLVGAGSLAAAGALGLAAWLGRLAGVAGGGAAWRAQQEDFARFAPLTETLATTVGRAAAAFVRTTPGGGSSAAGLVLVSVLALVTVIWVLVKAAEFYQE